MNGENLGLFFSLGTALSWAMAVILFKKSGASMDPIALNTFKNVIALALMVVSFAFVPFDRGTTRVGDIALLAASGAMGIGLADTLLFSGLNKIGASRQAIVDTLYSPAVIVLSYVLLGEVLSARDALGGCLILAAVVLSTLTSSREAPIPRAHLLRGITESGIAMVLMALAIVAVKPVLEHNDVLFCTAVRLAGGTLALIVFSLPRAETRRSLITAFRPRIEWKFAIPGALLGTYLSLLLWIGSFKYAPAGVAALLNQTSTLFIVLLAAMFLGERLTARLVFAVSLALAGSVVVLL